MIETLLNILPPLRADLAVKLTGVNGFTGAGEIGFIARRNGARSIEIELRGVAGREAVVYAEDQPVATLRFDHGHASQVLATEKGDDVPALFYGAAIEIRQNGEAILKGSLTRA